MGPLVVDPQALFAAGSAVVAAGDGLAANLTVLTAGFAAHTGLDAAGEVFGLAYQDAGGSLLKAAAAAVNACRQSGALIQQGASNYSKAEAASTLGGGNGALQAPAEPAKITAPGPPGTWGKGEPPPLLWAVVESFVDDVWPDGDVAGLHAAAARWRGFATAAIGMQGALDASKALLAGQQIPEGGKIDEALSHIATGMGQIFEASAKLARALDDFANDVSQAQNSIRDLLNRLGSLTDLGHDLMLIVKGDALEEIKKIANDINGVLHNLGREARAAEQGVKAGLGIVDGLVVKLEKYVRGELKEFLGDAVGNQVATAFDVFANANEGVLKGAVGMALSLGDLDPRWFLVDPHGAADAWAGMGKSLWKGSLFNALINPQEAGEANLQQLKGLLHLDDWSTARPGLGFGENAFDAAMLFIPGAGEAGAGADGVGAAARGAQVAEAAGAAGRDAEVVGGAAGLAGARGALTDIAGTGSNLTKDLEGVTGNLPKIEPPGGTPVALPPGKSLEAPVGPAVRPPDGPVAPHGPTDAPGPASPKPPGAGAPRDPVSTPGESAPVAAGEGGPREPVPAGSPLASAPAAAGERVPATVPQLAEHSPAQVPVSPSGAPVESAPVAAHSSQPALSSPSSAAPHFTPPPGEAPEVPASGGGWHGPPDGGPSGAGPDGKSPLGGGPGGPDGGHPSKLPAHDGTSHGPGDGPADHDGPGDSGDHPSPSDKLTSDDLSALNHYTGSGYQDLNTALRSDELDASQHARVEALNNALDKLPAYEGPVVRGTNLPPEALAQYRPGEYIIEKGFMSTTTNPAVAQAPAFAGNVEFRIFSCTGRDISEVSLYPAEQEVLFPAHTRFFVVNKTVDPLTGRTIIEMVEE